MSVSDVPERAASLLTCQLPIVASATSIRHKLAQVSPAYMKSAVPLRSKSIIVRSDGMLHVMPDTVTLLAAPLGDGPACQTTLPLKASTISTPRPIERTRVVGPPVALLMVHEPIGVL